MAEQPDEDGEEQGDELPADLDVTAYVGMYTFPDIRRRRAPGIAYLILAVLLGVLVATHPGRRVLVNEGFLVVAIVLGLIAVYHFAAAWPLAVRDTEALLAAAAEVGFPVGHASAQLAWRGLRSRPVWRVLLYSADEPPSKRGLVELDAVDGQIIGSYTEDNPEDWSAYGFSSGTSPAS
jgi:hypothetical protein